MRKPAGGNVLKLIQGKYKAGRPGRQEAKSATRPGLRCAFFKCLRFRGERRGLLKPLAFFFDVAQSADRHPKAQKKKYVTHARSFYSRRDQHLRISIPLPTKASNKKRTAKAAMRHAVRADRQPTARRFQQTEILSPDYGKSLEKRPKRKRRVGREKGLFPKRENLNFPVPPTRLVF